MLDAAYFKRVPLAITWGVLTLYMSPVSQALYLWFDKWCMVHDGLLLGLAAAPAMDSGDLFGPNDGKWCRSQVGI